MKLCIVTPKISKEALIIKSEAEEMSHECKRVYMTDIYFELKDNKFQVNHRKIELLEYDAFVFRSVNKNLWQAKLLAEYLYDNGKVVIDESLATERWVAPLGAYQLAKSGIPQIDMVQTSGLKAARDVLMEIDHPILIKCENGEKSPSFSLSEDWTDSYDLVRTNKDKKFQFQKHIANDTYFKIYIIGDKVLGGLKKTVSKGELRLNHAPKSISENLEVSTEMADLAKKATKAMQVEIATVDIVEVDGSLYVLEVKRAPSFTKFSRISGVNFAKEVVEYAVKRVNK